jgi:mannose-6-phosphate isomerase-like protein (cupin superfamily)
MQISGLLRGHGRIAGVVVLALSSAVLSMGQMGPQHPRAKVVALDSSAKELRVLDGPPENVSLKSGYIVLHSGESVGKHSTGHHEELLVVLEGAGEMLFKDGSKLPVRANTAVYCPPETEHDVMNSGSPVLRYVYVVAEVR